MSLSARRAWIEMQVFQRIAKPFRSLSARRAWIEIFGRSVEFHLFASSLSARRAWIEIEFPQLHKALAQSLSARRAWIEIAVIRRAVWAYYVALRKESVDRNTFFWLGVHVRERG